MRLSCPHDDFALLDNHLLVHLPTKIQVCDYRDAGQIETLGGTSFIAMLADAGGLLAPGDFPHPAAAKLLEKAQSDPSVFLIHPGVAVAIDVSGIAGPYQPGVRQGLEKAAKASGYTVAQSSPIVIMGAITGPKQEAVSYIASGSYVVNAYTSTIRLVWNGRDLWQTSGTNVPGMLHDQTGGDHRAGVGGGREAAEFLGVRSGEISGIPAETRGQSAARTCRPRR